MNQLLFDDDIKMLEILQETYHQAEVFLSNLDTKKVAIKPICKDPLNLPKKGLGAKAALNIFKTQYEQLLSASVGPRYFGYVTGGATPASIAGDWLVSIYDQNTTGFGDSYAPIIELETIHLLKQLLNLPNEFFGSFVSGATMANFVGLALARQWAGNQLGVDVAQSGSSNIPKTPILAATPHSSISKSLSMLGMGRDSIELIPCLTNRETFDLNLLEKKLIELGNQPIIVMASAGTVNTGDFDDFIALNKLKQKHHFWLHIDGAFGAFAACSEKYAHLVAGFGLADSITVDAHKWLNVPYDSGIQFSRHQNLQMEVFQNQASYLGKPQEKEIDFVHLTPENSRRFRALPTWMSLMSYGGGGYQEIIERNCYLAKFLGEQLQQSGKFKLLAPVRLNTVCFTFSDKYKPFTFADIKQYLTRLQERGKVFLTPTVYKDTPAIRATLSNWRTQQSDIEISLQSIIRCLI